ncbi:hypothetical protein [Gimesia aquarii]|uniref:Uncharacterized protein n=1 Tax=Gimesia aquarii TaxID=2527964 RepID=A0A517VRC9_9PLAN|nr:hypothetical protein [Gimesia aquarii]QDT95557.1 hypothetical protein V144x_10020 [Gimesia aquarii]
MSVLLDGVRITKLGWAGQRALAVEFQTIYPDRLHQLYAGRCLVGHTSQLSERRIIFQFNQTVGTPVTLNLAAVPDGEGSVEYGHLFGRLPANRFKLEWSAVGYPADADHFEIAASTEPGGEVDPEIVLQRLPYVGDGDYEWLTPYLDGSGQHKFRITPRDDSEPAGNAGPATEITVNSLLPPDDVAFNPDGSRFGLSEEAGVVTVDFSYGGV